MLKIYKHCIRICIYFCVRFLYTLIRDQKNRKRCFMIKKAVCCLLSMSLLLVTFGIFTACNPAKYEIGIFAYKYDDNYITTVRNALDQKLKAQADNRKINYTFYNGEGNQATQTAQIDSAITAGVDLLIINAVDQSAAGDNLAEKCKAAGKPAIFFNREVPDSAVNKSDQICFVGTDPNAPGYMLGEMIAELLGTPEQFRKYDLNGDGKIQYAMLRGDIGNPEADGRTKYSVQEANRLLAAKEQLTPGSRLVNISTDQNAEWDTTKAQDKLSSLLSSYPPSTENPGIEMVICNNDGMAMGAISALNAKGYNDAGSRMQPGAKYIPVYGVDAIADAVSAINTGKMQGTVKQDGDAMAEAIVKIALNLQQGKSFLEGTSYVFDQGVRKLRISYSKYTG